MCVSSLLSLWRNVGLADARGSDKCQLIAIKEFNQQGKQARKGMREINGTHLVSSTLIVWQVFSCGTDTGNDEEKRQYVTP